MVPPGGLRRRVRAPIEQQACYPGTTPRTQTMLSLLAPEPRTFGRAERPRRRGDQQCEIAMSEKVRESSPRRRSRDRVDRQLRQRRIGAVLVVVLAIAAMIGGYWWYGRRDIPRDGAPSWFPDGRAIVFAAEAAEGRADIFRMDADGGGRRRLTDHPANDSAPAVSPDGSLIVWESDRDGDSEIYVMDVSGGNPTRLTLDPAHDSAPAWSPDGR